MSNTPILSAWVMSAVLSGPALAGPQHGEIRLVHEPGKARVLEARPLYREVEVVVPEQHCWKPQRAHYHGGRDDSAVVGTLVGGVVGGVLGNQIGRGSGRTAMTVAGTAIGAVIGHRLGRDDDHGGQRPSNHCETVERVETREELVGYRVKYRYRGRVYHTRTQDHPGKWIRVDHRVREMRF